jgi:hypothetical protein
MENYTSSQLALVGANIFGNNASIMIFVNNFINFTYSGSSFNQQYEYFPSRPELSGYSYISTSENIYNTNLSIIMNDDYAIVPFTNLYNYIYDIPLIEYSQTNLYLCNLNTGAISLLYTSEYILDTYLSNLSMTDFSYNTLNIISTYISQDSSNITIVSSNENNNVSGIFYNNSFNPTASNNSISTVTNVDLENDINTPPQIYNTPFSLFTTSSNSEGQIITTTNTNGCNNVLYYTNDYCSTFTIDTNLLTNTTNTTYNINSISPITNSSYIYLTANENVYYYEQ